MVQVRFWQAVFLLSIAATKLSGWLAAVPVWLLARAVDAMEAAEIEWLLACAQQAARVRRRLELDHTPAGRGEGGRHGR